jgi:2-polyprenyl-6-methoxyphenol hydroxylase-like FAD-dependent oxidoreductase
MRYSNVTVLDRDTLPGEAVPRRGVPQSGHAHILLISGLNVLNALFAGFEAELLAGGGATFDTGTGLAWFRSGRRSRPVATGMALVSVSRPGLETAIRNRVAELPEVTIRDGVAVSGLTGSRDGDAVTGVVLDNGETIAADLVVDCTGRGSRSDRWLASLGFPAPSQVEIKVGMTFSTRYFRRRPGDLPDWQATLIQPEPPHQKTYGVALPVEDDRWVVELGRWHSTAPPEDGEQFERAVKELPDPMISELMSRAEPVSDVTIARFPSNRRRLFEKLGRLPAGYVALGDALCSFNPVYGQGMTCALQEAATLGRILDQHHARTDAAMARAFYAAVAKVIQTPWQFAVGNDFNYPETSGPRPAGIKVTNWYAGRVMRAAQVDAEVNRTFVAVQQLLTPPSAFFRPGFVARVLSRGGKPS